MRFIATGVFLVLALTACLSPTPPITTPGNPTSPPPPGSPPPSVSPPSSSGSAVSPIDTQDRAAVVTAYNTIYLGTANNPSLSSDGNWKGGSVTGCSAGATSSAFKEATLRRVNFYRALTGLPNVAWVSSGLAADNVQQAALMMASNGTLSHSPPANWKCYTEAGKTGAGSSNLAGGIDGTRAVDAYMNDGGGNNTAAGHRRWMLYPPRLEMASGDLPGWNALYVFGKSGPRPVAPGFIAYPTPGFFPRPLLPGSGRWSFSLPNANFSAATIVVKNGATALPVTKLAPQNGYGDNTVVWETDTKTLALTGDVTVNVSLENVSVSGVDQTFSYTTTIITP